MPPKQNCRLPRSVRSAPDHNYASDPTCAGFIAGDDVCVKEEKQQEEDMVEEHALQQHQLENVVEERALQQRFGVRRFAASNGDMCFFTRFASYDHFMGFWALIEPSLAFMVWVTEEQRGSFTEASRTATRSLQPIDEMFLFLNYLALGLKQPDLAERFGINQSTVNSIITTWSHFLYYILGSMRIWLPVENIREHLPAEFSDYTDTTVVLHCMELRCQRPTSHLLSSHQSHCRLKGLLGVAPHGAVTFVSPLYAGSISDEHMVRESGLLSLLKRGMAVVVDRDLHVDDFMPVKVYRTAFIYGRSQTCTDELRESWEVSRLRICIENLVRRVREHKFFDTEVPLCFSDSINQLYTVACLLTNFESGPGTGNWKR